MKRYFTRDLEWCREQVELWNEATYKYDNGSENSIETIDIDGGLYHAVVFHKDGEYTGSLATACSLIIDDNDENSIPYKKISRADNE